MSTREVVKALQQLRIQYNEAFNRRDYAKLQFTNAEMHRIILEMILQSTEGSVA